MEESMDTEKLKNRAKRVIPNGMYGHQSVTNLPDNYPQYYSKANGCKLWDVEGKEYIDYLCAYGPNILGYANKRVDEAVAAQQKTGLDTATGPSKIMVDLAEKFVDMTPGMDWCMFAKNGNDVTTLALTISRAATKKRFVLRQPSGYHGAGSVWTNGRPGVLSSDTAFQLHYEYNNLESVIAAANTCEAIGDIAAIIVGAFDYRYSRDLILPSPSFANGVRKLCDKIGALLIVDDVRAGFRISNQGSWFGMFGIRCDLLCYSKAISNGYALSALLGSKACREEGAEKVFATGSFWFSSCAQVAAYTTISLIEEENVIKEMRKNGRKLIFGLLKQADEIGLKITVSGPDTMPFVTFDGDVPFDRPRAMTFCKECCMGGVLVHPHHNWFLCSEHTSDIIENTLLVTKKAMKTVKMRHPPGN